MSNSQTREPSRSRTPPPAPARFRLVTQNMAGDKHWDRRRRAVTGAFWGVDSARDPRVGAHFYHFQECGGRLEHHVRASITKPQPSDVGNEGLRQRIASPTHIGGEPAHDELSLAVYLPVAGTSGRFRELGGPKHHNTDHSHGAWARPVVCQGAHIDGVPILLINAHLQWNKGGLDCKGARLRQARDIVRRLIPKFVQEFGVPVGEAQVVLSGDLNGHSGEAFWKYLTGEAGFTDVFAGRRPKTFRGQDNYHGEGKSVKDFIMIKGDRLRVVDKRLAGERQLTDYNRGIHGDDKRVTRLSDHIGLEATFEVVATAPAPPGPHPAPRHAICQRSDGKNIRTGLRREMTSEQRSFTGQSVGHGEEVEVLRDHGEFALVRTAGHDEGFVQTKHLRFR